MVGEGAATGSSPAGNGATASPRGRGWLALAPGRRADARRRAAPGLAARRSPSLLVLVGVDLATGEPLAQEGKGRVLRRRRVAGAHAGRPGWCTQRPEEPADRQDNEHDQQDDEGDVQDEEQRDQIGRASCRERVYSNV